MHIDLCKKEKDIENLTRQLQQQANYLSAGGHVPVSQKTNYLESFLVQQLKRQNRNMKVEVQEKDRLIEELKKNEEKLSSNLTTLKLALEEKESEFEKGSGRK